MSFFTTFWTVAAASTLLVITPGPAGAGTTASPATQSSAVVAGDVLFWQRQNDPADGTSIVKASAAAPAPFATVLTRPVGPTPYSSFSDPEVSPDGSKLAYIKVFVAPDAPATWTVEVRHLVTGSTTVLARETETIAAGLNYQLREPTWSPNGTTIAYVDAKINFNPRPDVRVVSTAGGPSMIVQEWATAGAWRPDGKLTVARIDPQNGTYTGLWITGATPADAALIPGSVGADEHAWSPDGAQVVFNKKTDAWVDPGGGSGSIETLPASGGTPTVIVSAANCNLGPVWSSNGQQIYFAQNEGCASADVIQIKRVPRTGGVVSTVVATGNNESISVTNRVAPPVPSRSHDYTGDGYADVIGRTSNGDLRLYFGTGVRLYGGRVIGTDWTGLNPIFSPGDFNSDGNPDVIGRTSAGYLYVYYGDGVGLSGHRLIGIGWSAMTAVFSAGDFTGDGHSDVIARTASGDLRLYFGNGAALSGYRVIGKGWNGITAIFSAGDFNGDGKSDVIGRTSTGDLRLYFGNGVALSGYRVIGTGWNGLSGLFSPGDFNLDGLPDVVGRMSNGDLRVYYNNGTRLSGYRVIGTGWNSVNPIL